MNDKRIDYDPSNPPLAKLHVTAQLDRDLARYKSGRTRLPWKAFPIKDKETKAEVGRIEFNSDGGISFTFALATPQERSWAINLQALYDCVCEADKLYTGAQAPHVKPKTITAAMQRIAAEKKAAKAKKAKRKARR